MSVTLDTRATLLATTSLVGMLLASAALAQQADTLPAITITAPAVEPGASGISIPLAGTIVSAGEVTARQGATQDVSSLLMSAPGYSSWGAGGVSGLPAINGLADDRVRVITNDADITSACANHMNPSMSYLSPAQVGSVEVVTGVTPVSKGGDSLGGTIIIKPPEPVFAASPNSVVKGGSFTVFGRSNGSGIGVSGNVYAAVQNVSIDYKGTWSKSDNYRDGNGSAVKSSLYQAQNQLLTLSHKNDTSKLTYQFGHSFVPYQGYPNQRMDMIDNEAYSGSVAYEGRFDWGRLDARAYAQRTLHTMNFLDDKYATKTGGRNMPMNTDGRDLGYSVKAEIPAGKADIFRIGNEFHRQTLDDWWPATMAMTSMMGPETYWTIAGGQRNRLGTFGEWERTWNPQITTLLGLRNDMVWMNTGPVQGYNNVVGGMAGVYAADAAAFNARDRARTDANFDATALIRYTASGSSAHELGYARKTRSPNLYERYVWSANSGAQMAKNMIGWFGDGNGYIGNPDLVPEVAHTISATAAWNDAGRKDWELKITPYYTFVKDYIGVRYVSDSVGHPGFVNLQFVNHDAELYGINLSGSKVVADSSSHGKFTVSGVVGYVHGRNTQTGGNLYQLMPLNARLALTQKVTNWTNALEVQLVAEKTEVDSVRRELSTPAYALVNVRTSYEWGNLRIDAGIENLFDKYYLLPTGGIDVGVTMPPQTNARQNVAGMGRTFYGSMTVRF